MPSPGPHRAARIPRHSEDLLKAVREESRKLEQKVLKDIPEERTASVRKSLKPSRSAVPLSQRFGACFL
jgi:hypothetical protein